MMIWVQSLPDNLFYIVVHRTDMHGTNINILKGTDMTDFNEGNGELISYITFPKSKEWILHSGFCVGLDRQ